MRRASWTEGWCARAQRRVSPNCGARPPGTDITLAVVHSISLPPGEYGGPWIEHLFGNRLDCSAHPYFERLRELRVSAHFLIRRNGRLMQFVSCNDRAWPAGASSWRDRTDCNDFSIGIELEGLEGERFEAVQYQKLAQLLVALRRRYPLQAVVGHEHVSPGRKHDPGPGFEWRRLARQTGWHLGGLPAPEA